MSSKDVDTAGPDGNPDKEVRQTRRRKDGPRSAEEQQRLANALKANLARRKDQRKGQKKSS
jgi:hypothetical protein